MIELKDALDVLEEAAKDSFGIISVACNKVSSDNVAELTGALREIYIIRDIINGVDPDFSKGAIIASEYADEMRKVIKRLDKENKELI